MARKACRRRIVPLVLTVLPILELGAGRAEQAKPGPAQGTVSAELTVDGKPLVLRHAVAVSRPDVWKQKEEGFTLALTALPLPPDVITSAGIVETVENAVKEGVVLHLGQDAYCKIIPPEQRAIAVFLLVAMLPEKIETWRGGSGRRSRHAAPFGCG